MLDSDGSGTKSTQHAFGPNPGLGGSLRMPSADLYRRHAATCRRLAHDHCDKEWTSSLISLAYEYEAKAAELDVSSPPASPGRPA
jgi:hypothetical protein